jgi:SNF2 family DNA or RNA helicase
VSLHNRASLEPYIGDDVSYYTHQVEGVRRMARMRSVLLADEMGLGKSLQTLTVFAIDVKRGLADKMLVVCPASLKENWHDEVRKFMGDSVHLVVLPSKSTPEKRNKMLEEFAEAAGPKVLVVNYEQVSRHLQGINRLFIDIAVFDEAHYLKNPKSKRTKAAQAILTKRALLLTGSPILNHVNELYPLLQRIGVEKLPSYYGFINRYCVFGGFNNRAIVNTKNEAELIRLLDDYMIRRRKADVLDLPPVQYIQRTVEMHPLQKKYYDQVVKDMQLTNSSGDELEIKNAMSKFLRLKQICGSTICVPGETQDVSHKLDQACDDAYEIMDSGHRVVAFTQFRGVQSAFVNRLEKYGLRSMGDTAQTNSVRKKRPPIFVLHGDVPIDERQAIIRAWSMSNVPGILVAMFQVAGVGLNMTAARHGLFLDKQFVPALNQQAVDRMHRIGADDKQSVQILEYFVKGSVEARVEKILSTKRRVFNNIVENDSFLRQLIEELVKEESSAK